MGAAPLQCATGLRKCECVYAWRHGPVHAPCSTAVARRSAAQRAERTGMGCIIGYMG